MGVVVTFLGVCREHPVVRQKHPSLINWEALYVLNYSILLRGTGHPSGPPQLRGLLRGQAQVNPTSPHLDGIFQDLPGLRSAHNLNAAGQFSDLFRVGKGQLFWKRRFRSGRRNWTLQPPRLKKNM
jgi:hypothetical protein